MSLIKKSNGILDNPASVIDEEAVVTILNIYLKTYEVIEDKMGLPPATLNTLQKLAKSN